MEVDHRYVPGYFMEMDNTETLVEVIMTQHEFLAIKAIVATCIKNKVIPEEILAEAMAFTTL